MGMAFAFAWTPCIGPVLGVVLGLASRNGTLAGGVLLLFAYSLGLGVPFVLVGLAFGRLTAALARARHRLWAVELVAGGSSGGLRAPPADRQRGLGVDPVVEPPQRPRPGPPLQELGRRPRRTAVTRPTSSVTGGRSWPAVSVSVSVSSSPCSSRSTGARAPASRPWLRAARTGALAIDGDDFYRGGDGATWDAIGQPGGSRHRLAAPAGRARTPATRPCGDMAALRLGRRRRTAGPRSSPPAPAAVVILDGAYSARPELADLLDLRVLLDLPRDVQPGTPAAGRGGAPYRAEWEARRGEAEILCFEELMPPEAFDLVLDGA